MSEQGDAERIAAYAERHFESCRSGQRKHWTYCWPTVRQCSKALRLRYREIEDAVEGHDLGLMLTGYNIEPQPPLGELFVEVA